MIDSELIISQGITGVTERCRLSWLSNSALVYEPKYGGEGRVGGLSQIVQLYTGAQINFGDLTSYLPYNMEICRRYSAPPPPLSTAGVWTDI